MNEWRPTCALDARVRLVRGRRLVARGPEVCELDEVASFVWDLCDGTSSVEAIARRVGVEYDVPKATALRDVRDLLAQLGDLGLLEPSNPREEIGPAKT